MNVALVNSGTEPCDHCGSRPPILLGGLGTPIDREITSLFERAWAAREDELTRLFAQEMAELEEDHREAFVSMELLLRQEAQATKMRMERAHAGFEEAVVALAEPRARRWRLFKRRWERQLADDITAVVFELREETRRA